MPAELENRDESLVAVDLTRLRDKGQRGRSGGQPRSERNELGERYQRRANQEKNGRGQADERDKQQSANRVQGQTIAIPHQEQMERAQDEEPGEPPQQEVPRVDIARCRPFKLDRDTNAEQKR